MLVHIFINGEKRKVHCQPDAMLLEVLRDAGCKSVKCGCDTTNCGLCTVWLDGKPEGRCEKAAPLWCGWCDYRQHFHGRELYDRRRDR